MRILGITQKHSGVGWHRIMMPLTHMKKDYCLITDVLNEEVLDNGFDIVVINRMLNIEIEQIENWKAKYNFKLVIDNDDYWKLDATHVLYQRYQNGDIANKITNLKLYLAFHFSICSGSILSILLITTISKPLSRTSSFNTSVIRQ